MLRTSVTDRDIWSQRRNKISERDYYTMNDRTKRDLIKHDRGAAEITAKKFQN